MSRFAPGNCRSRHSSLSLRCHMSCNSSGCWSSCFWAMTLKLCGVGLSERHWLCSWCACSKSPQNTKFPNHTGDLQFLCGRSPQAPIIVSGVPGTEAESLAFQVHASFRSAKLSIFVIATLWSELRALWSSELSTSYTAFGDATLVTVSSATQVSELSSSIDGDSAAPDVSVFSATGTVSGHFNQFCRLIFSKDCC